MSKVISVFNNKGGVGKTTICWNLADALGRLGKKVLVIDFDPQCNLSIAMLGEKLFINALPAQNQPYGTTIRAFLQRFLQNTGGEQIFLHQGPHTSKNVHLIAGDFWMNIYADSLNVGADLLSGTGLSRYVSIKRVVNKAEARFKASNPQFKEFDGLGKPVFAGWMFNGFDTARERRTRAEIAAGVVKDKAMIKADETMHDRLEKAVEEDLVGTLEKKISSFVPVANNIPAGFRMGDIEDANVLIQNSLWLSVPLGQLTGHQQVVSLYDRRKWAPNQEEQILLLRSKFKDAATRVIAICK